MDFKRLSGDEMITSQNIENVVAEETKEREFFLVKKYFILSYSLS